MPNNDLTTARAKLVAMLTDALNQALTPSARPAPVVIVNAPGGIGKTHVTAQLLQHRRVTWFGERNKLLAQVQGFLDTPLPGVTPMPPAAGTTTSGAPSVEKRPSREDQGFCSQLDKRIKPLQVLGLGRFEERMGCRYCPDRNRCKYQNWAPSTPWLFSSHARLGLRNNDEHLFSGREIVVIDESPIKEMLRSVTFNKHEIEQLLAALRDVHGSGRWTPASRAFTQLFEVVRDLLNDPPPNRRRVELRVLLRELGYLFIDNLPKAEEQLRAAANRIEEQPVKDADDSLMRIDPMATASLIQELQFIGGQGLGAKLHKLADALAADRGPRPTCVVVLPSKEGSGGIAGGQLVPLPVPPNLPIVLLDATCDLILPLHLFPGRPIIDVQVRVQQTARILQTTDHRYPARTLADLKSPALERLMGIIDHYKLNNPTHKVAAVVKKSLFDGKSHVKNRILKTVAEADVFFFWANRGENQFKDYDALFVLGAPELPRLEIEARARALMSQIQPGPDEQPFDYRLVPGQGDRSEGYVNATDGTRLVDRGYLQGAPMLVFYAFHQAEYAQAMLRLRPYDPTKRKTIVLFSNLDIPYLEFELVTEKSLSGQAPLLLVRALDILKNMRTAGHQGTITQASLAKLLGVSKVAITKMKKRYGDTELWREIELLMSGSGSGSTPSVPPSSSSVP